MSGFVTFFFSNGAAVSKNSGLLEKGITKRSLGFNHFLGGGAVRWDKSRMLALR